MTKRTWMLAAAVALSGGCASSEPKPDAAPATQAAPADASAQAQAATPASEAAPTAAAESAATRSADEAGPPTADTAAAPAAKKAPRHEVTAKAMPAAQVIDRKVLFGYPDHARLQVSADGKWLSWLAPDEHGVLNVVIAPSRALEKTQFVTHDAKRGIRRYFWSFDNRHVLYEQDNAGDENWHLHSVDLATQKDVDLTPLEKTTVQVLQLSPRFPHEALVGLNDRDPRLHDVYRLDLLTGKRTLVLKNEGWMGFVTDRAFHVRLASRMTPDGGMEVFTLDAKTLKPSEKPLLAIPQADAMTTSPLGYDATGRILYLADSLDRDTAALEAVDTRTGKKTLIAQSPKADVGDVLQQPRTLKVQAVEFDYTRPEWTATDPAVKGDLAYLKTVSPGNVQVVDRSLNDRVWGVAYLVDDGAVRYYRYDRSAKKATFLFASRKDLDGLPLTHMEPVVIPARDGLPLVSYLSLPKGAAAEGSLKPAHPLPMVLFVHGGPWGRDTWGYHPYHQWLANRGYAVLSVNFRGSAGFGKKFINAGDREWAAKMHDDLLDAVKWAVDQGITDRDSVAIMGGSYGGYATLVGLTFTPEAFACGVDEFGPSNLVTLLSSIPPYWKPMLDMFATRVGDPRTEEGRKLLTERSPLTRVGAIERPLLIGQGANDPRVKEAEADQIVRAMKEKGLPVTYVHFSDEGHGFARPQNNLAFNAIAEGFLAECLGGARQPIGNAFDGSTVEVKTGAEDIPGLVQALAARAHDGAGAEAKGGTSAASTAK